MHGGKFTFKKISDDTVTSFEVNDTTPSKINEAMETAATALSTTSDDIGAVSIHSESIVGKSISTSTAGRIRRVYAESSA